MNSLKKIPLFTLLANNFMKQKAPTSLLQMLLFLKKIPLLSLLTNNFYETQSANIPTPAASLILYEKLEEDPSVIPFDR
jgi:hypothetical protein